MIIGSARREGREVSSVIRSTQGDFKVWYQLPETLIGSPADSFFIASVLPEMTLGQKLISEDPVSAKLLSALPRIQEIFHTWNKRGWAGSYTQRKVDRIQIQATPRPPGGGRGEHAASFFTGGVDSFYTALKHLDKIDALIYVHGFDLPLERRSARTTLSRGLRAASGGLGKPLIEIETNLQAFSSQFTSWGPYHGEALASVGPLLAGQFSRIYIPATDTYDILVPWGSHPLLDPLWSTDEVQLVHDGCEANRIEKLVSIARNKFARRYLRVCMENPEDAYNCSSCEKCLRTLVQLRIAGLAEHFSSFPALETRSMHFDFKPRVSETVWRKIWRNMLYRVETGKRDPELEEGIRRILNTPAAP